DPADPRGPDAAGPARARRRFPALRRSPAAALVEAADHRPVAAHRHGRAADRAVAGGADHRIVRLRPGPFGRFDVAAADAGGQPQPGCRGAAGDRGDRPDRPGALAPPAGLAAPDEPAPLGRVLRGLLPPGDHRSRGDAADRPGQRRLTSFAVTSTTVGLLVVALLTTPLQAAGEELMFRGAVMPLIASWIRAAKPALVVGLVSSSLIFGLVHLSLDP